MAVKNLHSTRRHSIGKRFIKISASYLERIFEAGRGLIGEIEITGLIAAEEDRAIFAHKSLLLNRLEKTSLFQQRHATGEQAFADHKPGEGLFLGDEHAKTFALQKRGRQRTRRAGPNNQDRSEERRVGKECRSRWSP